MTAVFDTGATFNSGFSQITKLTGNVSSHGQNDDLPPAECLDEIFQINDPEQHRAEYGSSSAFPAFPRADNGSQLVFAEGASGIKGRCIAGPIDGQGKQQQVMTDVAEVNGKSP